MGLVDLLLFFCGRRRVMQVEGYSMWPTLKPQDRVIMRPLNQHSDLPSIGAIIVCIHPHRCKLSLQEPQFSITPGQGAVFYDGEVVLGGGLIDSPI